MLIGAGAEEVEHQAIGLGALAHETPDLHLVERLRDAREGLGAQRLRDLIKQILDTACADGAEHRRHVRGRMRNEGHQPPSASRTFW